VVFEGEPDAWALSERVKADAVVAKIDVRCDSLWMENVRAILREEKGRM